MARRLKEIYPNTILTYEELLEIYKEFEEMYFLPVFEFDALLSFIPFGIEEFYIEQIRKNDETYYKTEDGYEYVKIQKNRLLRLIEIDDKNEIITFRVSIDRIYYQNGYDINFCLNKCIEAVEDESVWLKPPLLNYF